VRLLVAFRGGHAGEAQKPIAGRRKRVLEQTLTAGKFRILTMSRPECNNLPTSPGQFKPETLLAIAVTLIYVVLGGIGALHHEMWRDETEAWLVARDAPLTELFAHLHYVGHPCVWFLILKPFAASGCPVETMQGIHLVIASTTIYLVMRFAPFPLLYRVLFCFGYFPLFEYGVICRNYAITLLLIVAILVLWPRRRLRPLQLGILLALLAHTTSHGTIVAVALVSAWLVDTAVRFWRDRRRPWQIGAGVLLAVAGIFLTYLQLRPPADSYWFAKFYTELKGDRIQDTLNNFMHAMIPVPRSIPMSWNTTVLDPGSSEIAAAAVGVILLVMLALSDDLASLCFYLCGTSGLLFLTYSVYRGDLRHHGFYYVMILGGLWLRQARRPLRWRSQGNAATRLAQLVVIVALPALFVVHGLAAAKSMIADGQYVFSPGSEAAKYLRDHQLQDSQFAGSEDVVASTVAAYLPARQVLYMEGDRWGSYVIWDQKRWNGAEGDKIIERIKKRASGETRWILILSNALPGDVISRHGIKFLAKFDGLVDSRERSVYLYQYQPTKRS
jgi:hypothetical protein